MSLAEILVALALTGSVLATTYTIIDHGWRVHAVGAARAESQQSARIALTRLAHDIRTTGRGADSGFAAILIAEPSRIVLVSDLDADGDTSARGEQITWQLVDDVLRRNAGAGAQPVANAIHEFTLSYFDAAGAPTTEPADVRIVDVTLVAGASEANGSPGSGVRTTLGTRVRLRNR